MQTRTWKRRVLSALLTLSMLLGMLAVVPMSAMAASTPQELANRINEYSSAELKAGASGSGLIAVVDEESFYKVTVTGDLINVRNTLVLEDADCSVRWRAKLQASQALEGRTLLDLKSYSGRLILDDGSSLDNPSRDLATGRAGASICLSQGTAVFLDIRRDMHDKILVLDDGYVREIEATGGIDIFFNFVDAQGNARNDVVQKAYFSHGITISSPLCLERDGSDFLLSCRVIDDIIVSGDNVNLDVSGSNIGHLGSAVGNIKLTGKSPVLTVSGGVQGQIYVPLRYNNDKPEKPSKYGRFEGSSLSFSLLFHD